MEKVSDAVVGDADDLYWSTIFGPGVIFFHPIKLGPYVL